MTKEEAKSFLIAISYDLGNMAVEYLTEKDGEKMREAIKALEQQRWIPVSEPPKTDEDVLVTNGRGRIYVGWIDPTDKTWRVDSESEYFMYDIVAWMPLPQPYKEKQNGK